MKNQNALVFEGKVIKRLSNAKFQVKLTDDREILASLSGKMIKNNITVSQGDNVKVETHDSTTNIGRIIFRSKVVFNSK